MKIMEAIDRNPTLTGQLLEVWESSVKATHLFLSEEEIENIKNYVPQAIQEIPYLIIAVNEHQVPVGFMGIAEQHLEMLFISDEERGKGLGRELLTFGIEKYSVNDLAVNEAGKRKDVNYQRRQMTGGSAPQQRADSAGGSMAATARQRMIEREGGNE